MYGDKLTKSWFFLVALVGGCAAPVATTPPAPVSAPDRIDKQQPVAQPQRDAAPGAVEESRAEGVSCFRPTEWSRKGIFFLLRAEANGRDSWLLTAQTFDQMLTDTLDNRTDYYPHEAVFRLDLAAGSLERVDDSMWQESSARARQCDPPAKILRNLTVENDRLLHKGRAIPTAGSTVLRLYPAPVNDVASVVSVDRGRAADGSSDVYYHQVYWNEDGAPMGPSIRLDFPRSGGRHTTACWTPDDQYVIYVQGREGLSETEQFCVVPAAE